jgi:hypothetical protein
MDIEQHKKYVDKLYSLEKELIDLIAEVEDEKLMNKFIEWSDQRSLCNESFINIFDKIIIND